MLKTVGNPATRYGDQTIIDGNLVIGTSGKGIDFSATSGAGTSELLDDYEEGDWTPTISGSVTPGTGTYFNQTGRYTKIGRLVFIQAWINCGGGHTGTGNMLLTGLPFTSASGGAAIFAGFSVGMFFNLSLSASNVLMLSMTNGTATIDAMEYPVGGGSATALALDPTCAISFSGCYIVD